VTATETLLQKVEALGWRAAVVPYARRAEAVQQIVVRHERGEFDEAFYQEYLAPMLGEPAPETPAPRSLILIAVPDRPVRMQFALDGVPFTVTTAPGYLRAVRPRPSEVIPEILSPFGYSAARIDAPLKTMGTISGFSRYGRNNISYVPGLGSFAALAALVSDLECEDSPLQAQSTLHRCGTCHACRDACPTGAIGEDRFLLHAERCITFWNEKTAEIPFPEWIEPQWHNALVGCLLCQRACPENRPFLDSFFEGPSFDEATTRLLVAGAKKEDVPDEVRPALEEWRLDSFLDYLPRNLGVLVKKEELRRTSGRRGKGETT
jgi:epoxyqueuosine reductase